MLDWKSFFKKRNSFAQEICRREPLKSAAAIYLRRQQACLDIAFATMVERTPEIVLSAGTKAVPLEKIPVLLAAALIGPYKDKTLAMVEHMEHLHAAVLSEKLPVYRDTSRVPGSNLPREYAKLSRGRYVVKIEDLVKYASDAGQVPVTVRVKMSGRQAKTYRVQPTTEHKPLPFEAPAAKHEQPVTEQAALLHGLSRPGIRKMFPEITDTQWRGYFDRENANGLHECRIPGQKPRYDGEKLALWIGNLGKGISFAVALRRVRGQSDSDIGKQDNIDNKNTKRHASPFDPLGRLN